MALERIVAKAESVPEALARRFEERAREAIDARGRFAVGLPGGSVATTCFPRLAGSDVDWSKVEFFWGDERAVPTTDPDSNYSLARALWLDRVPVDGRRVHRMRGEREDLAAAAAAYEAEMLRTLGDPPRLDLVILGVGPDGHVCSLFPGRPLLEDRSRWVAAVDDSPKPPPRRITLTLRSILVARDVVVVALGREKAPIVKAALLGQDSDLPVALVVRGASRGLVLLDGDSASLLEGVHP
jgi:6-phosphogluconolactonase